MRDKNCLKALLYNAYYIYMNVCTQISNKNYLYKQLENT